MVPGINVEAAFEKVRDFWSPKVIGQVNNQLVKIAKLKGEFVWHDHADEEELFFIVRGKLEMQFEDGSVHLGAGDMLTVPKGVRHNPVAEQECWVVLIEPASTRHTGDIVTERTKTLDQQY